MFDPLYSLIFPFYPRRIDMVMRVKRPLVSDIIPPCLITCVCIPVETGRAPSLQLDDNHSRTFYATLQVA